MNENMKVRGNVRLYSLPNNYTYEDFKALKDKDRFLNSQGKNTITTIGIYTLLDLICQTQTASFYIGVGTSSTAVSVANTDLVAVTSPRVICTDVYRVGNIAYFNTFFGKNDNNASWAEVGLFTAITGNSMIARKLLTFSKSTSNTCVISWALTLT